MEGKMGDEPLFKEENEGLGPSQTIVEEVPLEGRVDHTGMEGRVQQEQENIKHAMNQIEQEDEKFMQKYRDRKNEREMGSIDKSIANAMTEITGLRKTVYDVASAVGINLYRRSVLTHKKRLEGHVEQIEGDVTGFKAKLR
ncbi:hypothetical protein GOV09_05080, partial [Candidatus Woesearchaeota archaeon]|nr:hypothetical protein [Candidatus Woesearchaeota archaeon]